MTDEIGVEVCVTLEVRVTFDERSEFEFEFWILLDEGPEFKLDVCLLVGDGVEVAEITLFDSSPVVEEPGAGNVDGLGGVVEAFSWGIVGPIEAAVVVAADDDPPFAGAITNVSDVLSRGPVVSSHPVPANMYNQ